MPPLPDLLVQRPTTRAAARAAGIGSKELAGPLWRSPFRGVHAWSGAAAEDPGQRIREAALLLPPDGAVTGWAAAHLLGVPFTDGQRADGSLRPVPIVLPYGLRLAKRPEIRVLRTRLEDDDLVCRDGITLTSASCTAFTVLRWLPLRPAVAEVDALLHAGLVDLEACVEEVRRHPRHKGVPAARAALPLLDGRASSPGESRLRLVWVLDAGLPTPLVNPVLHHAAVDGRDLGTLLAIPDLLDPATGLVAEHDGAGHREARQHAQDNGREEEMEGTGLTVVRSTALDLGPGLRRLVHRLRSGYRRAQRQDPRDARWRVVEP